MGTTGKQKNKESPREEEEGKILLVSITAATPYPIQPNKRDDYLNDFQQEFTR